MRLTLSTLATGVRTQPNGLIDILGVGANIFSRDGLPGLIAFGLVLKISFDAHEAGRELVVVREVLDPEALVVNRYENAIVAPAGIGASHTMIDGLEFEAAAPGVYEVAIRIDGQLVDTLPFTVGSLRPPGP